MMCFVCSVYIIPTLLEIKNMHLKHAFFGTDEILTELEMKDTSLNRPAQITA